MHFRRGFSYVVGFDKPWFLSTSRIREEASGYGFVVVTLLECTQLTALPFATATQCGDGWDWLAVVRRIGPDRWIDMPEDVAFVVEAEAPKQLPPKQTAEPGQIPPPPQPTQPTLTYQKEIGKRARRRTVHMVAEAGGLFVALPVGWWASSKIKQRDARYALRGVLLTMAAVDVLLLASYLRE